MSKTYYIPEKDVETVENAIDAFDAREDIIVDRSQGRPVGGSISSGEVLARICEAYTGWSA